MVHESDADWRRPPKIMIGFSVVSLAVTLCFLFAEKVAADNTSSAMRQFGLIGTWSPDCSKEISEPRASRVVFAAPLEGGATATAQDHRDVLTTTVYSIEAAVPDSDKIRIALHPLTVVRSDGTAGTQHDYDNLSLVFQKSGKRIAVTAIQFEGLPEVERKIFFEKCVN